jgi:DNA-binding CsgD family transcriptional regulator
MFDSNVIYGQARAWTEGGLYYGSAGADGATMFNVTARPVGEQMQKIDDIDVYVGRRRSGDLVSFDIPMSGSMLQLETAAFEIAEEAPEVLKAMRPVQHLRAEYLSGLSFGWGLPRLITPARKEGQHNETRAFFDLFGRQDRAAVVLRRNGEAVHINPRARAMVGRDISRRGGTLIALRASEQAGLDAAIADVLDRTGHYVSRPILLSRPDAPPVIAQVTSVDPAVAGDDAVLMFLVDPSLPESGDPAPALQLLGLTPAEARVGALVGEGQPPRQAAETLGLTENTVRAALRIIYGKLGISRQSELAKLVARLNSIGTPP